MNPELLLSIVNTLLRDKYHNLAMLANYLDDEYHLTMDDVNNKLSTIGYFYNEALNQYTYQGDIHV